MTQSGPDLTARLAADLLEWRDGRAVIGGVPVEQIASECGSPLYLYNAAVLELQYKRLRQALPDAIEIYYSIKANPHPKVIQVFLQQGAGCEIASGGEYAIAMRAGADPERVVFAGPGKGREELEFVVARGIGEIHLESIDEIDLLSEIASRLKATVRVSIRVNPSTALGGGLLMGGQPTAFGFEEESLEEVVRLVRKSQNFSLRGVHLYTGTQILDAKSLLKHWSHAVEVAKRMADVSGEPVSTIDLGGGLGIPYFAHENELDLEILGRGASELVKSARADARLANCRFVVEPGRFLAGPAGMYVGRVRSVKLCRGTTFVVLDGGMNHNLAASGNLGQVVRRDYPIVNLSRMHSDAEETVVVVGPLCTPIDTLGRKVKMPRPQVGDLIGILQSGAYGLTASPTRFLSHATPAEVMVRNGAYEVITARMSLFESSKEQGCGA
jgi:diaminopimelate decarboxylase